MVSAISQFLVGFKGVDKAIKGIRAASYGTNLAKGLGTGVVTDFAFFDGQEERLSNLIQNHPALATIPQDSGIGRGSKRDPARRARHRMCRVNPVNEYLAAKPGDSQATGRLKNALEGLGIGMVAEGLMYGLRLTKAGREMRDAADTGTSGGKTGDATADAAREAAFKERQPAVSLTGKEFTATEPDALRKKVSQWYKNNLAGTTSTHPALGDYRFSGDAGKPISKSADVRKLQIFPKLKETINTSEHVASSKSINPKHKLSAEMEYVYTRNTVQIGDEIVDVGFVLRRDSNGQLYYDHLVHDLSAIKDAPWASPAAISPLSPKGTKGPKSTQGSHPALHGASGSEVDPDEGQVNLFILGTRSLRGLAQEENKESHKQ